MIKKRKAVDIVLLPCKLLFYDTNNFGKNTIHYG